MKKQLRLDIYNQEGLEFLSSIPKDSIDLVLVDPPYITSSDSGMDKWVKHVRDCDASSENLKTSEQWFEFCSKSSALAGYLSEAKKEDVLGKFLKAKEDYLKYGSIYGKKYAVITQYGDWDANFTQELLAEFMKEFYRVLRPGGTAIVFFDIWELTSLKSMFDSAKFKQPRFIEWIKTNPQPLNSSRNYLTNCREIAMTGVKKGSPTFNSKYDNGIYKYPIQGGNKEDKFHPTQKNLKMFEDLVMKHSNEGDLVLDCFLGSGTTALACMNTGRSFVGCEPDETFYEKMMSRVERNKNSTSD